MPEKDKDKKTKEVSETDTLIKKAKLVKEAPTGEEWKKVISGGKEVYVKRTKKETPPSETPVVPPKPDKTKDKVKYKGPPPSNKPKPKPKPKDTPKEEDFTEEVVTLEEKKPKSQQTGVFGDVQTYENIDPAKQWGADYGITTIETPDAEGRYTNTSRKYNIDKEGREITYDKSNPLKSFKDGKFVPTYTGRTIEDIRKEYTTQQIETPRMSGVYKRTDPNYQGSLMMPGTKATRIAGGGAGEFNQTNVGKIPGALSTAPVGYIEQKYDTQGKPIATPNQGVQFDEKNLTPLRKGEMEVGKMYDIPSKEPVEIKGNFAKGGKVMAPKMKGYKNGTGPDGLTDQQRNEKYGINNSGVVQVSSGQNQTNTGNVPLTEQQLNAKKGKNEALAAQLGSAAMTIGNQLNQQPIDYSLSEKQRQNADVASLGIDQALSATVPYYGLVKGASDIIGSMTAKDKYGEAKPGINAAINELTAMPTDRIAAEAAKGNALGVLRETSLVGKLGRTGMQVIGKGDETKGFFGDVNKALGTTDRKIAGEKYMAEQLAEAKAKDTAYKQSQAVANRDAGILEGAQVQGLYDLSSPEYDENRQLILKPGYAKGGVIGAAKMMYAKGGTIVGKGGPKDDAIFTKANKEGIEPGSFIVPAENNEKAKGIRAALFGDKNKVSKFKKGGEMESNVAVSNGEHLFTPKERKKIVNYLGEEILEELAPNAEENSEEMNMGGMLKRVGGYAMGGKTQPSYKGDRIVMDGNDASTMRIEYDSPKPPRPVSILGFKNSSIGGGGMTSMFAMGGTTGTMTDRTNMAEYKDGGLTKSKAKTMLHEGMANGKPITEQQRKYFGWVAGGSKESKMDGGAIHGYEKGGKIMAPKMMYANGTNVDGVDDADDMLNKYKKKLEKAKSENDSENIERYQKAVDVFQRLYNQSKGISDEDSKTQPTSTTEKPVVVKTETTAAKQPTATVTETKTKVKAPSVKGGKKGKKVIEAFEPMERRDVALEELRKMDEAQAIGKEQSQENVIMTTPIEEASYVMPKYTKAPKKGLANYVGNIDPGAAFSAYQIGQGSKLLKSGQRPEDVSKIDPAYNAAVERAQRDATFGYTPEQAAMLDQKAINALNDARFAGKNLASGSATTAFLQERQAINQGWSNALQLKSADQQLRMQKQQYADQAVKERADFLDMQRRRAFGDAMNTYNVNQESGSALVGAGVRNAIGAFRYQKELEAQERAAKIAGAPIKTD